MVVEIYGFAGVFVDDSHAAFDGSHCKNAVAVSRAECDVFMKESIGVGLKLAAQCAVVVVRAVFHRDCNDAVLEWHKPAHLFVAEDFGVLAEAESVAVQEIKSRLCGDVQHSARYRRREDLGWGFHNFEVAVRGVFDDFAIGGKVLRIVDFVDVPYVAYGVALRIGHRA